MNPGMELSFEFVRQEAELKALTLLAEPGETYAIRENHTDAITEAGLTIEQAYEYIKNYPQSELSNAEG